MTMKRYSAVIISLLLLAAVLFPAMGYAQPEGKTVRVGWYESPFNRIDDTGRRSGYAYEYQQKIAAYTGWTYEYVEGNWPELMQMLMDGEIDLMSDVSFTAERAEHMLFSGLSMGTEEYYIFADFDNEEIRQDDPRTLTGKKIGVNKDSIQIDFYRKWAEQYGVQAELTKLTGSEAEAMQKVTDGELDAYLSLDVYGNMARVMPVFKVGSSDFFFAVSNKRPDLLQELDSAMDRIQDENRYYTQQLSQKYISTTGAHRFLNTEEKNCLSEHEGVIRVGFQDQLLAFCAVEQKTGELTGALKDYLDAASNCFSNAQITYHAIAYPSASATMQALKNGEVDCMFPSLLSTADGEAQGIIMTPAVMSTDLYTLIRTADRESFPAKEQVTVAIRENDPNYDAVLQDHYPGWQKKTCPDLQACLKAVYDGKADCVLISSYQYNSLARLCEQYHLVSLSTGKDVDLHFAVNLGENALYSILTRTTNLVSDTSTYAALSYYSAENAELSLGDIIRHDPFLVITVLMSLVTLIVVVLVQQKLFHARKEVDESRQKVADLHKQAFVDTLTTVRNKGAYAQWEGKINAAISSGDQEPFAVVVCDINNLKDVNDLHGHKEGDVCIQNACAKICNTFSHSPVFRIGGDEFVVLLTGGDYYRRRELTAQINALPADPAKIRIGETISAGMAEYKKDKHTSLLSVFEEADKAMYERKQRMKALSAPKEDQAESIPEPEDNPVIHARKRILVADDIEMNREIMGDLLEDDYNISYAADGVETLDVLRSHKGEIDLVLLDMIMPNMDGRGVLKEMQVDEDLRSIPVIVLTVDQASELDCLRIGAMDFIPKPYPDIEIVKARIAKCIELSEDRDLIRYTERDKLTGLLNKDFFFRYVSRYDQIFRDTALDAAVCDVNRFHSANKKYGRQFGDHILRRVGTCMRELARKTGGICCRESGDTFLLYCQHQEDYETLLQEFLSELNSEQKIADNIGIRFGVFTEARQITDVEERFVRAKIAADRVKDDPEKTVGFYG